MIRILWILPVLLPLAGCLFGESEQAKQQEAVQYQLQQHDSAECADLGMLPGSIPFNDCMAKLGDAPPTLQPAR